MSCFRGLRLTNFKCFEGEHELELDARVYSVQAALETNEERSNWLGKTSFLESVRYLITGLHSEETLNHLITHGADSMLVEGELYNDVILRRGKSRKGPEVFIVELPDGRELKGDEAQAYVEQHIAKSEFFNLTNYIRQKKADTLAKMKGAAFSRQVNEWLQLAKVEEACEVAGQKLGELVEKEKALRIKVQAKRDAVDGVVDDAEREKGLERKLKETSAQLAPYTSAAERREEYDRFARKSARYLEAKELVNSLKRKEHVEATEAYDAKRKEFETAQRALEEQNREVAKAARLARGEFDGACPVAGIACPAKAQINADQKSNTKLHEDAKRKLPVLQQSVNTAKALADTAHRTMTEQNERTKQLIRAEAEMEAFKSDYLRFTAMKAPAVFDAEGKLRLEQAETEALNELGRMRSARERATKDRAELTKLETELAAVLKSQQPWREAVAILGREGAQRAIAQEHMGPVVQLANEALRDSETELRLHLVWESEGAQLSDVCTSCGAPYPKSRRVKVCARCNAIRGNKLKEMLQMRLSHTSGGAEDFAGVVFQLSVAAWQRAMNGIGLNLLMLDEPIAALDTYNSRALGNRLYQMIGTRFGFEQAFIVTHSREVNEAAPGRILISSDGSKSMIRAL